MSMSKNPLNRNERGSAAVECALVLPIMVALIAFTLLFGRLFWHYTVALKAAHDAATFLAMSRLAEVSIDKTDLGEIEIAKIAKSIAVTEVAELNPGSGATPVVDVSCDRHPCIGTQVPGEVAVMVQMKMFDIFLSGVTSDIAGSEGILLSAEVRVPYVGN
ncbi:TadE/TadG family type IV pilus assembly protein [Massilia sp. PWRC2]|uniref:TadE/TadG family type IV pilus assembly protein n=1 Tax=Massilia sp. PWRC2 TaxID=2804626 RepID=UPI003CF83A59